MSRCSLTSSTTLQHATTSAARTVPVCTVADPFPAMSADKLRCNSIDSPPAISSCLCTSSYQNQSLSRITHRSAPASRCRRYVWCFHQGQKDNGLVSYFWALWGRKPSAGMWDFHALLFHASASVLVCKRQMSISNRIGRLGGRRPSVVTMKENKIADTTSGRYAV